MEKDVTQHGIHQKVTTINQQVAVQREKAWFGETGLLSLGLSMMGAGSAAGLLGLICKRPGDITAPEMEQAMATATGKTKEELSVKKKQFAQLIKGVQAFINARSDSVTSDQIKACMNASQDQDTQAAVAVIKKTV